MKPSRRRTDWAFFVLLAGCLLLAAIAVWRADAPLPSFMKPDDGSQAEGSGTHAALPGPEVP